MLTTISSQSGSVKKPPKLHEVFWLEQRQSDVPDDDLWLGERERAKLAELRFAKRRNDWLLGRWTSKCALAAYLNRSRDRESLTEIEILAASDGAPEAWIGGQHGSAAISISHSNGVALTVAGVAHSMLGCDLERVEPRSEAFISDYFTPHEHRQLRLADLSHRHLLANLFWSAKESTLKAIRSGLRLDTRTLSVILPGGFSQVQDWHPLRVHSVAEDFQGWWKEEEGMVRTIVGRNLSSLPVSLTQ